MLTDKFSKHIFWSYHKSADLPDSIIIKQVAAYGEINDLLTLSKLYPKEIIIKVLETFKGKNRKRINFIKKVIF